MADSFYLDTNVLIGVRAELSRSSTDIDQYFASYLQAHLDSKTGLPPISFLGIAAQRAEILSKRQYTTDAAWDEKRAVQSESMPLKWGRNFIKQILLELRKIICGPKNKSTKLGSESAAVISAIAIMIVTKFHVNSVTANGFAVVILLALAQATRNAFCTMTDEEVLAALKE